MASEFPKDVGQPPVGGGGMIGRVQRLLLKPKEEWPAIDAEPMTLQSIMTSWVLPLAAIGPIAGMVRSFLFPITIPIIGTRFYPSLIGSVVQVIVAVALAAAGVWLWSIILDALAPNFKGTKNPVAALKLVAFSATAIWVCGIFQLTWWTLPLMILGLYSAYLFWVGVPIMMKVPPDQAPVYVIISIVIGVVVNAIVGWIAFGLTASMFAMTPTAGAFGGSNGTITIGGTTIDTGKINEATAKLDAATKSMQSGGNVTISNGKTVDPTALQNLLPGAIAGWNRTEVSSSGGGAMGLNVSDATARFASSDQSFNLKITDTGAMGSLAGIINVNENKQTATGYEKTMMQDGNMVTEKWDNSSKSGTYSVLVAKRFMVEAEGSAPSIDTLKGAVTAVNMGQLAAMAS